MNEPGIHLYWIPLGAGGSGFVRLNGRIYERLTSRREHRVALDLYHTALVVRLPDDTFVVETMWPRPDLNAESRGVLVDGPVFARWLGFTRVFRYEVRCWRDGWLPDATQAVGGPQVVSRDIDRARRLLDLAGSVPSLTWGRRPIKSGEMWNSNSVVSWLLAMSGVDTALLAPPTGGRAPGWEAGLSVATTDLGSVRLDPV